MSRWSEHFLVLDEQKAHAEAAVEAMPKQIAGMGLPDIALDAVLSGDREGLREALLSLYMQNNAEMADEYERVLRHAEKTARGFIEAMPHGRD